MASRSVVIILFFFSAFAQASEYAFGGFATLSYSTASNQDISFTRTLEHKDRFGGSLVRESLVGVQFNYKFNSKFETLIQFVAQDKIDKNLLSLTELAFIRYNVNRSLSFRIGRLNSGLYLTSNHRLVSHAYIWGRPPMEPYFVSSSVDKIDGGDVTYANTLGSGFFKANISFGQSDAPLENEQRGDFELGLRNTVAANIEYSQLDWIFRLSALRANLNVAKRGVFGDVIDGIASIPPAFWPEQADIAENFLPDGLLLRYFAAGIKFENEKWLFMSEASTYLADWSFYPSANAFYATVGRRMNSVTPFITVSAVKPKNDIEQLPFELNPANPVGPAINQLIAATNIAVGITAVDQESLSIGIRWDVNPRWVIKFQADRKWTDYPGVGLLRHRELAQAQERRQVNIGHISISTVF